MSPLWAVSALPKAYVSCPSRAKAISCSNFSDWSMFKRDCVLIGGKSLDDGTTYFLLVSILKATGAKRWPRHYEIDGYYRRRTCIDLHKLDALGFSAAKQEHLLVVRACNVLALVEACAACLGLTHSFPCWNDGCRGSVSVTRHPEVRYAVL